MTLTRRTVVPTAEEILDKYIPVLDYGFVALTDYYGGDKMSERAARNSYDFQAKPRTDKETKKLIRHLFREYHSSPSEFTGLTFHIGMPFFVARQMFRHRTLSINELSGRYSVIPLAFYTPKPSRLSVQCPHNKQGSGERLGEGEYQSFTDNLKSVRGLVREGYTEAISKDIARELARIDLPLSTYTYCYVNVDLRNLLHLCGLRSDHHAQEEIRDYSDIMLGMAKAVAPISTQAFLDYQFYSVNFTQIELEALKIYYRDLGGDMIKEVNGFLKENGMAERERKDFWAKLEPKTQRSFDLDLSRAKNAEYFEALVNSFAIELPGEEE